MARVKYVFVLSLSALAVLLTLLLLVSNSGSQNAPKLVKKGVLYGGSSASKVGGAASRGDQLKGSILDDAWWEEISRSVDYIGNATKRRELGDVLSAPEPRNSRAAFDKVVALSGLLPKITTVRRMATPSPEVFREYIAPLGLPVIFTDMLEGEKLSQWTWDYVRSKWGKAEYNSIRQGDYSRKTSPAGKHLINRVSMTLEYFIDVVTGVREASDDEDDMYIAKKRVIPLEALETEFYYPPFYTGPHKKCYLEPTGWIGSQGTFTQGHIDSKDNFAYQIIGEKRWTIFSPQDYKYLYYTQTKGSLEWSAVLNTAKLKPNLKKYPLYAKATPATFVTRPGEVLYLPRGWTHTVLNLTPNLMINVWRYGPAAITQKWLEKNDRDIREHCYAKET